MLTFHVCETDLLLLQQYMLRGGSTTLLPDPTTFSPEEIEKENGEQRVGGRIDKLPSTGLTTRISVLGSSGVNRVLFLPLPG